MDEKKEEDFLRVISLKGTRDILKYLDKHGMAQHQQLDAFINTCTLNRRLNQLLKYSLIQHHLDKKDARREWYSLTERGKKILKHLEDMILAVEGPYIDSR
ncbi:MAG: winged helix-turn-helix transcriptional regulator [Theionarchaea archaeon]|nr:winged helix-turn-helix transcriptional regulator [Theionarchaea archaeon]